jgi:hypothetical protein
MHVSPGGATFGFEAKSRYRRTVWGGCAVRWLKGAHGFPHRLLISPVSWPASGAMNKHPALILFDGLVFERSRNLLRIERSALSH